MSFAEGLLSRPHAILAATIAFMILGVIGFYSIPTNLFPDTNRPTISVVVQWPGAMTTDVATDVTHPLEVRLSSIDGVRRVTSTSRDEVSAVQVEFEYGNDINTAANEVTTELSRVRGQLPKGIHEPLVFKITDAAKPAMVLAVRPAKASGLDMGQVRRMAENQLRDVLLNLPGVADAEVFGGPVRQVAVDLDRNRLQAHQLSIAQVIAALAGSNVSQPAGMVYQRGNRFLLTAQALAKTPDDIAAILVPLKNGAYVRVGDLGAVDWGAADPSSLYHGNASPYLLTFAILWWIGFEFDMVTLSAIIIAVGLLADDVVVVMENIERRMREMGETGKVAATRGLDEILLADTSGTVSTILVLLPIMFIGGYVQTVLRPLTITLSVALFASLVVSVSMIPLFAPMIIKPGAPDPLAWLLHPFTRYVMEPVKRGYVRLVGWGLDHRALVMILFVVLFVASVSQLRFQGKELMGLMDTGISQIRFEAAPDTDDQTMEQLLTQVETTIKSELDPGWMISMSSVVGAEPGVKSFGAARLLQQGEITLNIVDRFHRNRTIFDINHAIQQRLHRIPGLISANVSAFGATPLSSLRATVDVMLQGPDPAVLGRLADQVMQRLKSVHGLTGMGRLHARTRRKFDSGLGAPQKESASRYGKYSSYQHQGEKRAVCTAGIVG